MVTFLLVAACAYGLGSTPFGLLLTRAAGLGDIRRIGSGNIGATNVLRTGRKGLALATLLLDGLKGLVAVLALPPLAHALTGAAGTAVLAAAVAAVAVVVGHCAPPWLGFRGGKGVATGLGALFGLDWRIGLGAAAAWLMSAAVTRRSSAGALAAFAVAVLLALAIDGRAITVAALLIGILITWRHRSNIGRLLAGTEPAIGRHAA